MEHNMEATTLFLELKVYPGRIPKPPPIPIADSISISCYTYKGVPMVSVSL